jgi:CRP-like cAMP-binding protein
MDLLERASALASCSLFESLAPAVLIRLAERARKTSLGADQRRTTDDTVWIVVDGKLSCANETAVAGNVFGMTRVVRSETAIVELVAREACTLLGLAIDDVRDILEEDPSALAALSERLAALLASDES